MTKTYEGTAIAIWFNILQEKSDMPTLYTIFESVEDHLQKYHHISTENVLSILIQMRAIIESEKIVIDSDKKVLEIANKALSQSQIKYDKSTAQNIKAVILDIYRKITPDIDGRLYEYLRGGKSQAQQMVSNIKRSTVDAVVSQTPIKKYMYIAGSIVAVHIALKYVYPMYKKVQK